MSGTHLLDSNTLIALTLYDHEHHQRVAAWAAGAGRIALCPMVQGALVRFLVRMGHSQATAKGLLDAVHASPRCEFWADAVSFRDVYLTHVVGHRQVTDAYLASLAAANHALLATLDEGLARTLPKHVVLIP